MFSASTDTSELVSKSNVVVVAVPLFVDIKGVPDFRILDNVNESIGNGLKKGSLVSYETTLPVGTTRSRCVPMLEFHSEFRSGRDFHVVFSPERVLTGRVFQDLRKYPKLVGGVTKESEDLGVAFYSKVLDFDVRSDLPKPNGVWSMGNAEASEFAKIAETTYRDVNIALANQFALFAHENNIDFSKVVAASNSQPYSQIHQPGIAVGGHCIPIYPQLYLWNDPSATVVRAAREANEMMPMKCVEILESIHGSLEGQAITILGVSYRGEVKETAFSGVFSLVQHLETKGALVTVHDPLYSNIELESLGFSPFKSNCMVDAIIVQANHEVYAKFSKEDFLGVRTVFDGRGILDESNWEEVKFYRIGQGDLYLKCKKNC